MHFLRKGVRNLSATNSFNLLFYSIMMNFEHIVFSVQDNVAHLRLNRPKQLNSFNDAMHAEVRAALKEVRTNTDIRVLLITAEGRGFCAGQDLQDRNVAPSDDVPDLGRSLEKNYNPLVRQLRDLTVPVVCAVNGVAAGAGANIALACDIVLAARSASFVQAFCKIGLMPDSGGTWLLPRLVGNARARALTLLGEKISAEQAEQWGMIYRCIDDECLFDEASKLAGQLACQATYALTLIKRALNASAHNSFDE